MMAMNMPTMTVMSTAHFPLPEKFLGFGFMSSSGFTVSYYRCCLELTDALVRGRCVVEAAAAPP
jgi:hypothetical protein